MTPGEEARLHYKIASNINRVGLDQFSSREVLLIAHVDFSMCTVY